MDKTTTITIPSFTITYQPINKCWGINLKEENRVINEVDTSLSVAIIEFIRKYDTTKLLDNGELY